MKKFKSILLIMTVFMIISCSKKNPIEEVDSLISLRSQNKDVDVESIEAMASLVQNYMRQHTAVEPNVMFQGIDFNTYLPLFQVEKQKITSIGQHAYIQELIDYKMFPTNAATMILENSSLLASIDFEKDPPIGLAAEFEGNYKLPCKEDAFYCYVYSIIYNLYQDFENGDIEPRGGCGFAGFFDEVMNAVSIGYSIGNFVPGAGIAGIAFGATGAILGGAVGIIVGIFTFNDDCEDCGPVTSLSIQSDDQCDLTRTIIAGHAGSDVAGYVWTIVQNGTTVTITTVSNRLGLTQTSPQEPVYVAVIAICPNPDDGYPLKDATFDLNVVDIENPLGQAGDISISHVCPHDGNTGGASYVGCNSAFETHGFYFTSTNQASGNMDYSYNITPNTFLLNETSSQSFDVEFTALGNYNVNVVATNNCTGDSTEKNHTVYINN